MKNKVLSAAIVLLFCSSSNVIAAPKMPAYFENDLIQMCEALRSDNRLKLRRVMKRNHVKYKHLVEGLRCNGQDAISFALKHDSMVVAKTIARNVNLDFDDLLAKK